MTGAGVAGVGTTFVPAGRAGVGGGSTIGFPPSGVIVMGGAGALFAGVFFGCTPSSTVVPSPALRVARIERDSDVIMNRIAEIVVALESKVADPRGPKAVCEPIPPNAPARSAAFPLCSKTTIIRKRQTTM